MIWRITKFFFYFLIGFVLIFGLFIALGVTIADSGWVLPARLPEAEVNLFTFGALTVVFAIVAAFFHFDRRRSFLVWRKNEPRSNGFLANRALAAAASLTFLLSVTGVVWAALLPADGDEMLPYLIDNLLKVLFFDVFDIFELGITDFPKDGQFELKTYTVVLRLAMTATVLSYVVEAVSFKPIKKAKRGGA